MIQPYYLILTPSRRPRGNWCGGPPPSGRTRRTGTVAPRRTSRRRRQQQRSRRSRRTATAPPSARGRPPSPPSRRPPRPRNPPRPPRSRLPWHPPPPSPGGRAPCSSGPARRTGEAWAAAAGPLTTNIIRTNRNDISVRFCHFCGQIELDDFVEATKSTFFAKLGLKRTGIHAGHAETTPRRVVPHGQPSESPQTLLFIRT